MSNISLGLLVPRPLSRTDGDLILSSLLDGNLQPEKFGNWEPLKHAFVDVQSTLEFWQNPFLWKSSRVKSHGGVWITGGKSATQRHSSLHMDATDAANQLLAVLKECSAALHADFGYMHVLSKEEIPRSIASNAAHYLDRNQTKAKLHITTWQLTKYLPDLYWGTVFGRPYIDLFSRQLLLSSPAQRVEEIDHDCVYIQLTESIDDLVSDFELVEDARVRVKQHLGNDAFFDWDRGVEATYQIPAFRFSAGVT
jgi:hypothetical protein